MAKRLIPLLVLVVLLLSSCGGSSNAAGILLGNSHFSQGRYQKAILRYLDALDVESQGQDIEYYNLANVYYALGEGDAALETWQRAEDLTDDPEVLFRIAFNRGILFYQWGRYDEAYRAFRRSLVIRPSDVEAKINLEASLSRIRSTSSRSDRDPSEAVPEDGSPDPDNLRLLDYMRRKEAGVWSYDDSSATDYTRDW